ncbi:MAG: sterol carrier family protein [Corynebacterium sp.]|uniref:sterol carrier family protein n=1 Tax=Corynebacterium sp. TaxID=1720 RepID=UPI0026DB82FF|nr:sterol carrier family protein [Corynebacterium sp.]MDO5099022.1 sterol carrier family protein [Corynebacterium sp.]
MAPRKVDPKQMRAAVTELAEWITHPCDETPGGGGDNAPSRAALAAAVRLSVHTLGEIAPGGSVEVRVPPFAAVQCIAGPSHNRGTPPNVVEMDPRTWLRVATGVESLVGNPKVTMSGTRAPEVAQWLPLLRL